MGEVNPLRIFVIGAARSGTTLTQAFLAAHPAVVSLPETHFFPSVLPGRRSLRRLGLARSTSRRRLLRLALLAAGGDRARAEAYARLVPRRILRCRPAARAFAAILDRHAAGAGAAAWVEKTPRHVRYVDEIERLVPGARFIHVLRDGRDVVASVVEVSRRHPGRWAGERTPAGALEVWAGDVRRSLAVAGGERHHLVRYEALVADPGGTLREACRFAGLGWESEMLEGRAGALPRIARPGEAWKSRAGEALGRPEEGKSGTVLSAREREGIAERIRALGLDDLKAVVERAAAAGPRER